MMIGDAKTGAEFTAAHAPLGRWSSHPKWLGWNARVFRWLASVPLVLLFGVAVWFGSDVDNWLPMLRNAEHWVITLVALTCFFLAALITISLCQRLGEIQSWKRAQAERRAEQFELHWPVIILSAVAILFLPLLLLQIPGLPAQARSLVWAGSMLPLACILLALRIIGDAPGPDAKPHARTWLLMLFLLVTACSIASWIHDFGLSLRWRLLTWMILPPLALTVFALWRLWPRWELPRETNAAPPGEDDEAPTPPAWLKQLVPPEGCSWGEAKLIQDTSFAPLAKSVSPYFLPFIPTEDQAGALKRFDAAHQEMIDSLGRESLPDKTLRADLILHGEPGSGRTATLLALALHAFLSRGQRVLWLVPEDLRKSGVLTRLSRLTARLHLDGLVPAGALNKNLALALGAAGAQLPCIGVATLEDWEEFCGAECGDDAGFERLRRALLTFGTLLVDDVDDFPDAARLHLPFSLDKHRLHLEAHGLPVQLVAAFPALSKSGGLIAGARLSGKVGLDAGNNVLFLRPPQGKPAWRVDVQAANPRKALEQLAIACLQKDLQVVVYRKGLDDGERKQLQNLLLRLSSMGDGVRVIADLDQAAAVSIDDSSAAFQGMDAVLYHASLDEDACLALRLNFGSRDTILFSFSGAGETRRQERVDSVPVLTDRSAMPLVAAHALNLLRFLKTNVPIPSRPWAQLGVEFDKLFEAGQASVSDECRLRVDRLPLDAEAALQESVWDYVTLDRHPARSHVINIHSVPDESQTVARLPMHARFTVVRTAPALLPAAKSRRVLWTAQAQGEPLLETDLAAVRNLRVSFQSKAYVPEQIVERADCTEIVAQHWLGGGMDFYIPDWRFQWELRDDPKDAANPEDLAARGFLSGGMDSGALLFEMDLKLQGVALASAQLTQLFNEHGGEQPINAINFQFPATYSCMLLAPPEFDPKGFAESMGAELKGIWKTDPQNGFLPALTGVLNYAFNVHTRGLSVHARILAFKFRDPAEDEAGKTPKAAVVVWFIEPVFAGRTPMTVLTQLLREPEQRHAIFSSMVWALERIKASPAPVRELRRLAGGGFGEPGNLTDTNDSLSLLRKLRDRTGNATG